jgi:hypothetical protein
LIEQVDHLHLREQLRIPRRRNLERIVHGKIGAPLAFGMERVAGGEVIRVHGEIRNLEFRIWNAGHKFQIPTSQFLILQRALSHGDRAKSSASVARIPRRFDALD